MKELDKELNELMSIDKKKEIVEEIGQEDLLEVFKNYKPTYKPIIQKKSPLDQQISLGITKNEKERISEEVRVMKKAGEKVTISSLVRSRAIGEIDIEEWRERALIGLKELNSKKWDKPALEKDLNQALRMYDELDPEDPNDEEDEIVLRRKIDKLKLAIEELERPTERRGSRMSGRVTFNEANHIRWRAGRLTLTVADYMRFMIFGYVPFTEQDRHLSIDARKRFYIAILDIAENGWGEPPYIEECPNCARYAEEVKEMRKKLDRLQKLS